MNGKLDITECDNPVLSHRVATATGDLDQLCVDLTFFTFIFSSFIVCVVRVIEDILHLKATGHTGCPKSKFPLCFGCFLGFPCLYRGSFYHFSTAQETMIPKLTLLSSLCQKFIKLQSKM